MLLPLFSLVQLDNSLSDMSFTEMTKKRVLDNIWHSSDVYKIYSCWLKQNLTESCSFRVAQVLKIHILYKI